ncbi:hypothetical protein VSS74_01570 [Conexibacter stalactiti]|uniref:Uncharacterized protein n=1 Tax=Conexibacter stalactiti TaxID=1940611 RepID=A0ABU4HIB1_9ACTN|nr:hypothetical protein [Conexibacter stalactiti]MDW5593007.1 hypothetical protein [Conexibacter stalactiti]MEC5033648.1 hypothetical protein [Conexibacter stalactiti]
MIQARPAGGPRMVQTHSEAVEQFRRPFAAGAIGFRITHQLAAGDAYPDGAVVVVPYVRAQSVIVRLNSLIPGRWSMRFDEFQLDLNQIGGGARLFLICRLTVTLPREAGGPDVDVMYEDVGEAGTTVRHPVKALYSDARKRAAAAAGIGTYLYTVLPETTLPANGGRVANAIDGELVLTSTAITGLRERYREQVARAAVTDELGEVLQHGEPDDGPADDPARSATAMASSSAPGPASTVASTDEPVRDLGGAVSAPTDGAERDRVDGDRAEGDSLGGWGNGRPVPPPAPVALTRGVVGAAPTGSPQQTFSSTAILSADHRETICREAERANLSGSALANIVIEASGKPTLDEQAAAREFDSGLLNRTPDTLVPKVLAAIRARGTVAADRPAPAQLVLAGDAVPLDFGALSDDAA